MSPLVSVIVPVYNVEQFLPRCLDSIVQQTYNNIEILLINDGSTDNSLSICEAYKAKDERIRVFSKKNEGLGYARNYGIEHAAGAYFTFVDSDDYLTLSAIEKMMSYVQQYRCDVVICNNFHKDVIQNQNLPERLYKGKEIVDILIMHMLGNKGKKEDSLSYTAWGKLYKASLFKKVRFASERQYIWEDMHFSINLYSSCNSVYISSTPVYYYCYNADSLTHTYVQNKIDKVMTMYRYMLHKIDELNIGDSSILRLNTSFVGHIRTCIKLEVLHRKDNGYRTMFNNIRSICSQSDVQQIIKKYPSSEYNKSQKILAFFIKKKFVFAIYILAQLQIIYKGM